ncbi:hypothetical protein PanWU01x14_116530 [Parasponia andersonii]|uniref:Uncharacterized protein n=1 Tax=Parasponia andersonii TaxID=3476 RepID=A0A2P5CWR5_PARAD|nr:hypothetical protein PanWU01x14_116530 [Parasponia andersonii]
MSSHGSTPVATSATSGSNSGDDRHEPKGKRVREETRGSLVEKQLRRLKTDRLKVEFCEKTGKPILDHCKMFLNILAKMVRDTIPASTLTWKDVKKKDIELILNQMEVKFDYPWFDALFMVSRPKTRASGRRGIISASGVLGLLQMVSEPVPESMIMSKALGTRSRWQKGLGALPQLKSIGG